jgi:threonine aldolase
MHDFRIDLRSDTKTRPSTAMRAAMSEAPVGDEQLDEDPSVNELTARVAALLGKSRALFLPSGTMCNLIAILVSAERGIFSAMQAAAAIRPRKVNSPTTRLIHVEQTVNRGGGAIWPIDVLRELAGFAREQRLAMHIDGARLMNAVVGSGVAAREFGDCCDSVWLDLSKGLGCPIGAVLAGNEDFIFAARRWKFRLGGAMRQAGVVAAAGLYALDNNVERLQIDHENARRFADALRSIDSVSVHTPETNLVFFEIEGSRMDASQLAEVLARRGIGLGVESRTMLRAVTHLDVNAAGIDEAAAAISNVLG